MVGWYYGLNEHEFEQAQVDGEGQRSLGCCSSWVAESQTRLRDCTTAMLTSGYQVGSFSTVASLCLEVLFLL